MIQNSLYKSIFCFILGSHCLFALKNPKTEFEIAVRHFNSDRVAIAEKILTKRTLEEWGDYSSAVLLLRIKCANAQGDLEGTKSTVHDFFSLYPESKYKNVVYQIAGDVFVNEGLYSKALEYYLISRKYSDEKIKPKIDKRILNTISIGLPAHDIEAIRLLEIEPHHIDILQLASAISHLTNGDRSKAEVFVHKIDPLNLPERYFNTYDDILKSVAQDRPFLRKIGIILPLTGESEAKGNRFLNGIQAGFLTQTELDYSLLIYDNESSLMGTIQNLKDISRYSNIPVIIGPLSSQFSLATVSSKFAEGKNLILPYFNTEGLIELSPNAIQLESSFPLKGKLAAKYMTEILALDSIAIIAPSTPEGRQCVDAFLKVLDQKEINPILVEWYSSESRNMKRQFSSLRKMAWELIPEDNEFAPFLGMDIDSLSAMFSIDTDDFFEDEVEEENPLKTKRDSSKISLATIDGLYLPLSHNDLSIVGTQFPMYNLQTQIVGHDGWLDLETLNKDNIGPHFQDLFLLTSTMYKYLNLSDEQEFNRGNTEFVDGYDTALFLLNHLSKEKNESFEFIETHSHTYYFPDQSCINQAVNILRYKDFQFNPLGHFLSDSLVTYAPQTP